MNLLASITSFFQSLFNKSAPDAQKKFHLRKLEAEIKDFSPCICKNGMLQGNFGEAIFTLYKTTRSLDNLFAATISPLDIPRQHRFEAQLIMTAYNSECQDIINHLNFDVRKAEILGEYKNADRIYLRQRKNLEHLIKELNTESFKDMDRDILELRKFVEFCHYNFVPFLQLFDYNFEPANPGYRPNYSEVALEKVTNLLEDLYYVLSTLHLTSSMADAVIAIAQLRKGDSFSDFDRQQILSNLKKINFVINRVIPAERLLAIIRYAREDEMYEPQVIKINGAPRQEFAEMLKSRFDADEKRIKSELQDEKISEDVETLFSGAPLLDVGAYNQNYNTVLQNDTPLSFQWVLPLRILKTFLHHYITGSVKTVLNDLVIEGFFNNPTYKTTFSSVVYGAINADKEIEIFEESFGADQKNSIAVMESYIKDSKKDKDFYKKLEKMVSNMNNDAYTILQNEVTNLVSLYRELGELLEDAKKPSSEIISNLKVLLMSSRNRDNTNFLESHYPNWEIFFEIMRNYVIISSGERT